MQNQRPQAGVPSTAWVVVQLVAGAGMWAGLLSNHAWVWAIFAVVFSGSTVFEAVRIKAWRMFGGRRR